MKILFSGYHNPNFWTITEYMERAIEALGHDLYRFDDRQHLVPGKFRQNIKWLQDFDLKCINDQLIALAMKTKPDMAVITGGHRIQARSVNILKEIGAVTVLWTIDPPIVIQEFQPLIEVASHYNHIVCQGTEAIELFQRAGITNAQWLPMACDPSIHQPVHVSDADKVRYAHEVVFMGSHYSERAALFEHLTAFDLAIWGPGWNALKNHSSLRKHVRGNHTPPAVWLKIYSSNKIILATHYHDPNKCIPVYQASPRIFEAMSCGAFVISDNQRDVFTLFEDGKHLVRFNDAPDLVAKVRYYLDHPQNRQAIAMQGRAEVLKRHTYQDRIKTLLSIVGR